MPSETLRTCIGCRTRTDRRQLVRIVLDPADHGDRAVLDRAGTASGRGAWIHPDPDCLELALTRRALARAFRTKAPIGADRLREQLGTFTTDHHSEAGTSDGQPMSTQQ